MKEPWSSRWYWSLLLAVASMVGLMLIVVMIVDAFAEHVPQPGSQALWQTHLQRLEDALTRNDLPGAELRWSEAYAAALRSRHWEGLVAAGDAYRRLGARAGFLEIAEAKARQTYFAALFRARSEMSLEGVLQAARGFVELGDAVAVQQCLQVARLVAAETKDPQADARVRAFRERWLTATRGDSFNQHSELPTDRRQGRPGRTR